MEGLIKQPHEPDLERDLAYTAKRILGHLDVSLGTAESRIDTDLLEFLSIYNSKGGRDFEFFNKMVRLGKQLNAKHGELSDYSDVDKEAKINQSLIEVVN